MSSCEGRDIETYCRTYMNDYGFEATMVKYRHRLVLERLRAKSPRTVIEVGCGSEWLYNKYLKTSGPVDSWVIVEPSEVFANMARDARLPNAIVINRTLEGVENEIYEATGKKSVDFIICSSVLHEVIDAAALLAKAAAFMDKKTILHVNVPNATSFHRQLARAMGLIRDLDELSERNQDLLQHRVYDIQMLTRQLEFFGFCVQETGGILVKPFTHKQMVEISGVLSESVLDGLDTLARKNPTWASEIFVDCVIA
jgi:SAM-dependent methyltransferase